MKISIVIPVYNEEDTLLELVEKVKKVKLPEGVKKEIILVDDGSRDKTSEIIKKIKGVRSFTHRKNRGKGAALRNGFDKASGQVIIIQDADLEYNPNDYKRLLKPVLKGNANVVYGSRLKDYPVRVTGTNRTPFLTHYFGNKLLTTITNLLYGANLTDMETCYKVFKKEILKDMDLKADRFEFEPEFTAKILKRGYSIKEVPIKVKPRGYNEGKKITWKDGFIAVWTLLKYRFVD